MAEPTHKILFVCMGNICRSPAAEGVLQHLVNKRGLSESFLIDSAGTIDYHAGHPADKRMRSAARRRGYDLTSKARPVARGDLDQFDLVLAMDRSNLAYLESLHSSPRARVDLFSFYLGSEWPREVPDPYYGGNQGFDDVLDMLEAGAPAILDELLDHQSERRSSSP